MRCNKKIIASIKGNKEAGPMEIKLDLIDVNDIMGEFAEK